MSFSHKKKINKFLRKKYGFLPNPGVDTLPPLTFHSSSGPLHPDPGYATGCTSPLTTSQSVGM